MSLVLGILVAFLISLVIGLLPMLIDPESNRRGLIRWYPDRQDILEWWQRRPKFKDY